MMNRIKQSKISGSTFCASKYDGLMNPITQTTKYNDGSTNDSNVPTYELCG